MSRSWPYQGLNRQHYPVVPAPVPTGYIAAEVHFVQATSHLQVLFQFGGVVVRDRAPGYCSNNGWSLRKVYVDPQRFDQIRYALACAGIAELRRKGTPRLGVGAVVESMMAERTLQAHEAIRHHRLHYADALA